MEYYTDNLTSIIHGKGRGYINISDLISLSHFLVYLIPFSYLPIDNFRDDVNAISFEN